ncbi:S8 family serine peptidase [Streptomyces sp. ISL-112]|uniref:S8 family serine peptidase n=1 Tax=unclassified Streptomyces TaxID=2593676 RepID=UPI001BE6F512|nr:MULTISPECIES: S8 family serine peptidase [unclassified Streptomyces]MBT2426291.1 S8 family serine peptidase [Streptomyces sp. ISL-112]MBT2466205.1 S8 family serine peptidase [Streptomyces sp. ISL-63]
MTAGMGRPQKRVLSALAVAASWSVVLAGAAQPVVAADVQSKQWYLNALQAEEMWKVTTGEGIKVAVIDTGVNASTPSLKGQVLKGLDATNAAGDEHDDYRGHGTNMAELIAGTGKGGGLRGLAPGVKIIPMRISDTEFQNENSVTANDYEVAIRAAADSDAQIISMSFASDYSSSQERDAVKYAQQKGKLFFAGVGNNAEEGNKEQYPASYPQVVGVAAADRKGKVSEFSTNGNAVDIAAPGSDIPRWCNNSFKSYCDGAGGTSAATAIASASAALVWSAHPDWTANQVLNVLFDTAGRDWEKGTLSKYLGHGLIRPAMNILKGKGDPGDPDISPLTEERTGGSPASAAPSSAASAPASQQPAQNGQADKADEIVAAGDSEAASDDGAPLGLIVGGIAGVAVLGGVVFAVVRRRGAA